MALVEPWHEYLVLPGALAVLALQLLALLIPRPTLRRAICAAGSAVMAAIFATVLGMGLQQGTANIGAGIMLFLLPVSGLLTVTAFARVDW
ncbi:MAG TPA: hypothetical protein VGV36_00575 [Solirubrobacteraceae bacterium]|nr:hypothetical protein [Solirubrobacteraceae bacterium]